MRSRLKPVISARPQQKDLPDDEIERQVGDRETAEEAFELGRAGT